MSGATVFEFDQVLHLASLACVVWFAGPGIWGSVTRTLAFDLTPAQIALLDGLLSTAPSRLSPGFSA